MLNKGILELTLTSNHPHSPIESQPNIPVNI